MLRVGLTGGIGSGKSAVAGRLAALGAVVLDGDKAARAVVEPGTPGLAEIAETFGAGVLRPDGSLDRAKLAAIVFADEAARMKLNAITHPLIHARIQAAEEAAVADGGPETIVVHDIPLLAEGQRAADFELVIVVDAPPEVQVARLAARGLPEDQARARMAAQATREQRLAIADIVIDNSGTLDELDLRVGAVWTELVELARGRALRAGVVLRPVGGGWGRYGLLATARVGCPCWGLVGLGLRCCRAGCLRSRLAIGRRESRLVGAG